MNSQTNRNTSSRVRPETTGQTNTPIFWATVFWSIGLLLLSVLVGIILIAVAPNALMLIFPEGKFMGMVFGSRPFRMAGSHIDITELKHVRAALRHREVQLAAAQQIQENLLPQRPLVLAGLHVAGTSCPAEYAAGDHFDYFEVQNGGLAVTIGDVTAHGIGPALITACVHTLLRSLAQRYTDVRDILQYANEFLCEETEDQFFATVFFAQIDRETRRLEYASAGHPPAYVLDRSGRVKAQLESTGIPLGVRPEDVTPMGDGIELTVGDLVVLVTDGVVETRSPEGELFGANRMLQRVRRCQYRPAQDIIDSLYDEALAFSERNVLDDDVTAVVLKVGRDGEPEPGA